TQPEFQQGSKPRIAVGQTRGEEGSAPDDGHQNEVAHEAAGGFSCPRMAPGRPLPGTPH
ncbi:MAG: hypothetical protein K0Q84_2761, partial [Arthrobacter sp.]|nr:hypothetical protein [Arthrobacter sp.]